MDANEFETQKEDLYQVAEMNIKEEYKDQFLTSFSEREKEIKTNSHIETLCDIVDCLNSEQNSIADWDTYSVRFSLIAENLIQLEKIARFLNQDQRQQFYNILPKIMILNIDFEEDLRLHESLNKTIRRFAELYIQEVVDWIILPVIEQIQKGEEIAPGSLEVAMNLASYEPFTGLTVPALVDCIIEIKEANTLAAFRCLYLLSEDKKVAKRLHFFHGVVCQLISWWITSMESDPMILPREFDNRFLFLMVNIIAELEASAQKSLIAQFLPQLKQYILRHEKNSKAINNTLIILAALFCGLRSCVAVPEINDFIERLRKLTMQGYQMASIIIASMLNKGHPDLECERITNATFLDAMYIRYSGINSKKHEAVQTIAWLCKAMLSKGISYWKLLLDELTNALKDPGSSCSASGAFRTLLVPATSEQSLDAKLIRHWTIRILCHQWLLDEAIPRIVNSALQNKDHLAKEIINDHIVAIGHLLTVDGSSQLFRPHVVRVICFWLKTGALDHERSLRVVWPTIRGLARLLNVGVDIERNSLDQLILKCRCLKEEHDSWEIRFEAAQCLEQLMQMLPECCQKHLISKNYFCHCDSLIGK